MSGAGTLTQHARVVFVCSFQKSPDVCPHGGLTVARCMRAGISMSKNDFRMYTDRTELHFYPRYLGLGLGVGEVGVWRPTLHHSTPCFCMVYHLT